MATLRSSLPTDLKVVRPLLWLLFHFFRLLVRISLLTQLNQLVVLGRNNLRNIQRPTILAVNHPSTMMDVFITAPFIPRVLFFLANYSLFKNPLSNWLLRRLYSIPIKRKEDVGPDEALDNDQAFEQSYQHLENGGALFVAPEGVSWTNRFIRPLKTGTARIALGVEARQMGALKLHIIPIGLTYLPNQNAIVQIGEPIPIANWLPKYLNQPTETVQELTLFLQNSLQRLTIHTVNESGELAVTQLETILQNEYPIPPKEQFFRSQSILDALLQNITLRQQLHEWFQLLQSKKLMDAGVAKKYKLANCLLLITGLPAFLFLKLCYLLLGCNAHKWLVKYLNIYAGYNTTIKLLFNTFISFPILLFIASNWLNNWQLAPFCLLSALASTYFTRYYQKILLDTKAVYKFKKQPKKTQKQLVQQRTQLLKQINSLPKTNTPQ